MLTRHFIGRHYYSSCCLWFSPRPGPWRNPALRLRSNRQRREMSRAASLRRAMKWRRQRKRRSRRARTRFGSMAARSSTVPLRHVADPARRRKDAARMFFVAYTRDGEDVKTRPVSFLYNGGPGAATIWLHMVRLAPNMSRCPRMASSRRALPAGR